MIHTISDTSTSIVHDRFLNRLLETEHGEEDVNSTCYSVKDIVNQLEKEIPKPIYVEVTYLDQQFKVETNTDLIYAKEDFCSFFIPDTPGNQHFKEKILPKLKITTAEKEAWVQEFFTECIILDEKINYTYDKLCKFIKSEKYLARIYCNNTFKTK